MLRELRGLERRRGPSGKDSITHRSGEHDDRANVIALANYVAGAARSTKGRIGFGWNPRPGDEADNAVRWGRNGPLPELGPGERIVDESRAHVVMIERDEGGGSTFLMRPRPGHEAE